MGLTSILGVCGLLAVLASFFCGFYLIGWTIFIGVCVCIALFPRRSTEKVDPANKAVFITGCDSGFGNKLARRLDAQGYTVFAGCLFPDQEGPSQLKQSSSERLHVIHVDVTDEWLVRGAVKYVKEHIKDKVLWAVVNNAGIAVFSEIEWCPMVQFQRIFDVNVMGVVRVTKAFLPIVRSAGGRIINVASLAGRFTLPGFAAYSMSKRACISFSDALRIEMKKFDLKVITIEPGLYKTPISETKMLQEQNRKSWSETPPDVKEAYGEEYFDDFLSGISKHMERARPNVDEVVDLMEDAVVSAEPKVRYVPSSSVIRAGLLTCLPSPVTDKLFQKQCPTVKPRYSSSSVSDGDVTH